MGQVQSPDLVCEESEVGLRQAVKSFAFKVILKNVFRQVFNLIDFLKKLYYNNKGKWNMKQVFTSEDLLKMASENSFVDIELEDTEDEEKENKDEETKTEISKTE